MDKSQEGIVAPLRKAQKGNSRDVCRLLDVIEELDSECDDANATIDRLRDTSQMVINNNRLRDSVADLKDDLKVERRLLRKAFEEICTEFDTCPEYFSGELFDQIKDYLSAVADNLKAEQDNKDSVIEAAKDLAFVMRNDYDTLKSVQTESFSQLLGRLQEYDGWVPSDNEISGKGPALFPEYPPPVSK